MNFLSLSTHSGWECAGSIRVITLATLTCISIGVLAAEPARINNENVMRDPWVPPSTRVTEIATHTRGAQLQAQVERKLKDQFVVADATRTGTLTREQARSAGLGFVANNFDQIDTRKTGVVNFDEIKHFLRERGTALP